MSRMTREENLHWLNEEIRTWENECQSKHPIKEALHAARKALEQKPCEDAVSRTEVLKLVRFNAFRVKSQIKAIENMPSVTPQEPRWIPVTERLPEEDGGYLVTVKRGYVTTAVWIGITKLWNEVTAWMPLPEPYKGGE